MTSVHLELGISTRSSYCHYLPSSETNCKPADSCIQRSPQIVDVRGMKGKDAFRMRWTSWTLEAGFWCLFLHLLGNIWFVRDVGVRFPLTPTTAIFVEPRCIVDFCWKFAPTAKARYPSQLASALNAGENNDPTLTEWRVFYEVVSVQKNERAQRARETHHDHLRILWYLSYSFSLSFSLSLLCLSMRSLNVSSSSAMIIASILVSSAWALM